MTSGASEELRITVTRVPVRVDTEWMTEAACRDHDPEIFFSGDSVGVEAARAVCRRCPVVGACLDYAMDAHIEHGVGGCTSERGRRRVAQERRRRRIS